MQHKIVIYDHDLPAELVETYAKSNIAIDTETMGLEIHRDKLCLIQLFFENDDKVILIRFDKTFHAPNLRKLLINKNTVKIFHYARFDVAAIKHYLHISVKNVYCTKIASRLARTYTDSHGLKDLCRDLLGVSLVKTAGCSDWGAETLSKEQQDYAASDVLFLHDLKKKLDDILSRLNRSNLANSLFSCIEPRVDADLAGWSNIDIFAHSIPRKT